MWRKTPIHTLIIFISILICLLLLLFFLTTINSIGEGKGCFLKLGGGGGSVFVDQGFASFYQAFCYKISWNYLKFKGMKSGHSLIPNLNPSSSDKFYVSNGFFVQKRTSFTHFFKGGGGPTDPRPLYHLHYSYTVLNKRKNKRGTNKESH